MAGGRLTTIVFEGRKIFPHGGEFEMKKILSVALSAIMAAGCATSPNNITAEYVSPLQYQNYTCDQLIQETRRIGARVSEVTGQQQAQANNDAIAMGVGLVIFWPALFFLANNGDKKAELSRLKGEYDAVQQAGIQKNCSAPSPQAGPAPAPKK